VLITLNNAKFQVSVNTNPVFLSLFRGLMTSTLIHPEEHFWGVGVG